MKKILYIAALAVSSTVLLSSCEDFLNPESKTNITIDYLTNSPDGLNRAAIGLYALDREIAKGADNGGSGNLYVVSMCDYTTDLMAFRAGTSTAIAKLENFMPNNGDVEAFWQQHYFIIGKANEVIAGAEALGVEDPDPLTRRAYGEAKFFRGRAYFELWKRFERLYLNTEPTTVSNLERDFTPASKEDIFTVIRGDLDTAIEMLDQLSAVCKRFGVDYYAASQNQRDLLDSIALHEYQLKKAHEQGLKRSEVPPFLGLKRSDRSNDMPA